MKTWELKRILHLLMDDTYQEEEERASSKRSRGGGRDTRGRVIDTLIGEG